MAVVRAPIGEQSAHRPDRYRAMVDALPDLLFIFDTEGRFLDYHAPSEDRLAAPPEVFLGKKISEVLPPDIAARTLEAIEEALSTGKLQRFEYELNLPYGHNIFEARMTASGSAEVVTLVRNITEERATEEALLRRTEELEQSNEDLEQFSYAAAHDLKGPIHQIQGFTDLLKRTFGDDLGGQGLDYIAQISSGTRAMGELITSLLDYARTSHADLDLVELDIEELVQELASDYDLELRCNDLPQVRASRDQMRQLFRNLFSNAAKFRSPQRDLLVTITGSVEEDGSRTVAVSDNGIGFDMELHSNLFEAFRRLHSRRYEGSGVGLSICARIMERHGGGIDGEGTEGEGATFTLRFPAP